MPIMVDEIAEILRKLKQSGVTILLVEQNYQMAFGLDPSARVYIMEKGGHVLSRECRRDQHRQGTPGEILRNKDVDRPARPFGQEHFEKWLRRKKRF